MGPPSSKERVEILGEANISKKAKEGEMTYVDIFIGDLKRTQKIWTLFREWEDMT